MLRQVRRWRQGEEGTRRQGQGATGSSPKGPEIVIICQRWGTEMEETESLD